MGFEKKPWKQCKSPKNRMLYSMALVGCSLKPSLVWTDGTEGGVYEECSRKPQGLGWLGHLFSGQRNGV